MESRQASWGLNSFSQNFLVGLQSTAIKCKVWRFTGFIWGGRRVGGIFSPGEKKQPNSAKAFRCRGTSGKTQENSFLCSLWCLLCHMLPRQGGEQLELRLHTQQAGTNGVLSTVGKAQPKQGRERLCQWPLALGRPSPGSSRRLRREAHSGCVMKGLLQLISPSRACLKGGAARCAGSAGWRWWRGPMIHAGPAMLAKESFPLSLPSQASTQQRAAEVTRSACYCALQEGRYTAFRSVYQLTSLWRRQRLFSCVLPPP